jgi:hypothetical protein
MGRIRASATDLRNRRIRLSWDSPGLISTLIELTPSRSFGNLNKTRLPAYVAAKDWQAIQV